MVYGSATAYATLLANRPQLRFWILQRVPSSLLPIPFTAPADARVAETRLPLPTLRFPTTRGWRGSTITHSSRLGIWRATTLTATVRRVWWRGTTTAAHCYNSILGPAYGHIPVGGFTVYPSLYRTGGSYPCAFWLPPPRRPILRLRVNAHITTAVAPLPICLFTLLPAVGGCGFYFD